MVWGYMLHLWIDGKEDWENHKQAMRETKFVDDWHSRVGCDELLWHRHLTDDGMVEESIFSSGRSVIANFGPEDQVLEHKVIHAGEFILSEN